MDAFPPGRADVTLGLLAGGAGRRLGGVAKAWLERDGVPQVARLAAIGGQFASSVIVSSNADPRLFESRGWRVAPDVRPGLGPIGGLDALARACRTPWLLTLPVDLAEVPVDAIRALLAGAGARDAAAGARVEDGDGPQPLVALWVAGDLRDGAARAIEAGDLAVHALQSRLGMTRVRLSGVRFGNLNTEADLRAHRVSRAGGAGSR